MSKYFFEYTFQTPINVKYLKIEDMIYYDHFQDCCENVYVDFSSLENDLKILKFIFNRITKIKLRVEKHMGIVMRLYDGKEEFGVFLPCRNEQNGYYNDALSITIKVEGKEYIFDLQQLKAVQNIII